MGIAISSNSSNIQQDFYTRVNQISSESCTALVEASSNNNQVIINGAIIEGNFTGVSVKVSTDASCSMVSSYSSETNNILSAIADQSNQTESSIFNGILTAGINNSNVGQTVVNNINQINTQICDSTSVVSANNNYIYVSSGTTIGGNFVGVTAEGQANASCAMTNYMKSATYNQAQAKSQQTNVVTSVFGQFFGLIVALAIIGAIVAVITVIVTGVRRGNTQQQPVDQDQQLTGDDLGAILKSYNETQG